MAKLNIYKIDNMKIDEFDTILSEKLDYIAIKENVDSDGRIFEMSLYMIQPDNEKDISWNWLLKEFEQSKIMAKSNPRGIIKISIDGELYVATFGSSYFLVDKYSDRKFPFEFAKRSDYKDIRTTALHSPGRQRNKTVNTYSKCSELEYDSGESFSKIKANIKTEKEEKRFNGTIEIGNSIKFSMKENTLDNIVQIINYIDATLEKDIIHKIPLFNKVDGDRIIELDNQLIEAMKSEDMNIEISELDIIGVNEIFNHNDMAYTVEYDEFEKNISDLNLKEVKDFIESNQIDINNILNVEIVSYQDDSFSGKRTIKELVDYTNDKEEAVLFNGFWYEYNDDYVQYLTDSLEELQAVHNEAYNFLDKDYNEYVNAVYDEKKKEIEDITIDKIKHTYYKEYVFNSIMEENHGFKNYDRKIENGIESMDLYKDKTMFAVKIGNTSSKLCYVIDQSITSLRAYKSKMLKDFPEIENVAIWIILERKNQLSIKNGKVNINELDMLMLKNRIDNWKKNVRLMGYKPIVYVNYFIK
ncbi:MAG: TIGR04141 family sporadically distributed protein [Oscillospiraceae bacterium]|nr:TIGR04141 family sporadically distributed protein [Oscillospiraceae bacterium]